MKRPGSILLLLLLILAAALFAVAQRADKKPSLLLHCAAGMRIPVVEIAKNFEAETGIPVRLQFGGSGALEAQLEVGGGDLFFPADNSYLNSISKKGLLAERFPAAILTAGIVVEKGNPKSIWDLADLARPNIRLSMADVSAAIGKHVRQVLTETGELATISKNITVTKPTVNNTVEDVAIRAVDATIAWDAVARGFSEVEWIAIPAFSERAVDTGIAVLRSSKQPVNALKFATYMTAEDTGAAIFRKHGFTWQNTPTHE